MQQEIQQIFKIVIDRKDKEISELQEKLELAQQQNRNLKEVIHNINS